MSLTLPSNPTRTNCDAGTDDPKQALLADLYNHVGTTINFLAAMGNLATKQYGSGLAIESQGPGTADKVHVAIAALAKTAAYTVVAADRGKLIDCTSGTFTLSLTAAGTLGDGWFCYVRNSGAGIVTLDPNSTEQIDGATTITLAAGESCAIQCTGAAFKSIGKTTAATTFTSTAEIKTGTEAAKAIAPDKLLAALGFSARYNSGNQTIRGTTPLVLAHGLGREPVFFIAWLKCLTAEGGYSIGDKVHIPGSISNSALDSRSHSVVPDATNITIMWGNGATSVYAILNKSTGAGFDITNANWALVIDAWA